MFQLCFSVMPLVRDFAVHKVKQSPSPSKWGCKRICGPTHQAFTPTPAQAQGALLQVTDLPTYLLFKMMCPAAKFNKIWGNQMSPPLLSQCLVRS